MLKKVMQIDIAIVNIPVIQFEIIMLRKKQYLIIFLGKYFCLICHSDKRSYLPSYIINKWDFSNKHSVSNFAYDYLNRIYTDPSFNLNDLNPRLYDKSKKLKLVDELRWSLYYLRHYILTCRFAGEIG
jgi:hypothetical protein